MGTLFLIWFLSKGFPGDLVFLEQSQPSPDGLATCHRTMSFHFPHACHFLSGDLDFFFPNYIFPPSLILHNSKNKYNFYPLKNLVIIQLEEGLLFGIDKKSLHGDLPRNNPNLNL